VNIKNKLCIMVKSLKCFTARIFNFKMVITFLIRVTFVELDFFFECRTF
jgi:hypothetical protein